MLDDGVEIFVKPKRNIMKKIHFLSMVLISIILVSTLSIESGEIIYLENIVDRKDQQAFQNVIAKGNIVVDFYADWCGPCNKLNSIITQAAREFSDVTFIKVNIDTFSSIRTHYNIKSIPTLIYFKDGSIIKRSMGLVSKKQLLGQLKIFY